MFYLITNSVSNFNKEFAQEQTKEFNIDINNYTILILPKEKTILKHIRKNNKIIVISNKAHITLDNLFITKKINKINYKGINLTSEQELKYIHNIEFKRTSNNFNNYIGRDELKRIFFEQKQGVYFLLGLAGVGKSYFTECLAGELNIPILDLNLNQLLESTEPILKLREIFKSIQDMQIILRIDEIEHMLDNAKIKGEILTILNDLNTDLGFKSNNYIVATSNSINTIMNNTPQLFREGRIDKKIFMSYPNKADYIDTMITLLGINKEDATNLYLKLDSKFNNRILNNLFIYSPSELTSIIKYIKKHNLLNIDTELAISKIIANIKPLQQTASKGFEQLLAQAKELSFQEA